MSQYRRYVQKRDADDVDEDHEPGIDADEIVIPSAISIPSRVGVTLDRVIHEHVGNFVVVRVWKKAAPAVFSLIAFGLGADPTRVVRRATESHEGVGRAGRQHEVGEQEEQVDHCVVLGVR